MSEDGLFITIAAVAFLAIFICFDLIETRNEQASKIRTLKQVQQALTSELIIHTDKTAEGVEEFIEHVIEMEPK